MDRVTPGIPGERGTTAALQKNATELQRYWINNVLPRVARRWVWWSTLSTRARAYNVDMATIFGPELVARNNRLNDDALRIAGYMVWLSTGALQVQPWSVPTENGPLLRMSFIARDSPLSGPWWTGHRHALSGSLGAVVPALLLAAWTLAPGIVTWAVRAVVGAGVFVLADAWLSGRAAEMEASEVFEQTRAKAMEVIAQTSKVDPVAGAKLAKAFQHSMLKANQTPVGDLIDAVTEGVKTVSRGGFEGLLPYAAAWWFFTQRKKA